MVELSKYFEEICLLIKDLLKILIKKFGKYVETKGGTVNGFVRYEVGEGMEKREENFAEEVMKQVKK